MRVLVAVGAAVAAAGATVGGMTWGATTVERQYERAWDMIEQEGTFEIVSMEYQRGLRSSSARTEFALRDPVWDEIADDLSGGAVQRMVFVLEDSIDHGPVFFGGDGRFGAARIASELTVDDAIREGLPWLGDRRSLANVHTVVDFNGSGRARYTSPAFEEELPSGQSVRFSGLTGTSRFNRTFDEQSGDLVADSLVVDEIEGGGRLSIRDVAIEADLRAIGSNIWAGTTTFRLGEFVVDTPDDAMEARGLDGTWVLDEDDGLLTSEMALGLERFHLREAGADHAFDNMRLRMTAHSIDAGVAEQLIEWTEQLNLGQMGENEYAMRSMSAVPELLAANPRITVDEFHMETPDGVFTGSLGAEWVGGAPDMNNPFALFNGLAVDFSLTGPEKWWGVALGGMGGGVAGSAGPQAVEELVNQGLMVRDNGEVTLEFGVRDGMIQAQGQTLGSVWQFLGAM